MLYKRLSTQKVNKILLCFCEDITATAAAKLVKVNRKTANNYYNDIREKILKEAVKQTPQDDGEFELDESYFGAKRVRGKRGRGAAGKTPVFGLLKRGGKVFVKIVKNCSKEELMPIIQGKILEGAVIHTDGWKAYDGLILNGYDHYRVFHSHNEFARGKSHVNGIENFWSFAKRRLSKFNGCASDKFILHLKECEFRYNHRNEDLLILVSKIFKR
ncbi:MAG: IS1595 family transposase [Treponema sp.]|jgi:transposase|nr:IS1595 family transposase [Treponema sp.]